jgi:hypothetical protein
MKQKKHTIHRAREPPGRAAVLNYGGFFMPKSRRSAGTQNKQKQKLINLEVNILWNFSIVR